MTTTPAQKVSWVFFFNFPASFRWSINLFLFESTKLKAQAVEAAAVAVEEVEQPPPEKKWKHHMETTESGSNTLLIGDVSCTNDPENDSMLNQARHGEAIQLEDTNSDFNINDRDDDEEDDNVAELDDLEQDDVPDDSEWCLAGQALEREFLSGDEDWIFFRSFSPCLAR